MSFYTSLTGLNAATAALSVTSNNIANVGTTGFKRSRADFGDIFATSPLQRAASVIGQGVSLKQVTQEFSQGNIQFSASSLDLAITGDGFFPLKSPDGLQDIYTRNGTFLLDDSFAVVNSAGQFLEAASVDSNGKADLDNLKKLIIPRSTTGDARATSLIDLALNLPAEGEVITTAFDKDDPKTYNLTTSVTVFDAGGNEYLATVYYAKTKRASPDDPTNKYQTHVFIGDTKLNELLIQATDQKGEKLYVNKYGEIRSENGSPPIPPEDIARGVTKLFNLDDLKNLEPSVPATASGSPLTDGLIGTWKNGFNIPTQLESILNDTPIEGVDKRSPIHFSLNVDGSDEPVFVDLSYLNEPGASLSKTYTGVEIAREMTNAINKAYGDERYFDLTSLKASDTATSVNLFKLFVSTDGASPTSDDIFTVSLEEQRTNADPLFGSFRRLSEIRTEDAVTAIQSQISERSFVLGQSGAKQLAVANHFLSLATVTEDSTVDSSSWESVFFSDFESEKSALLEQDALALAIAEEAADEERPEKQRVVFSAPRVTIADDEPLIYEIAGSKVRLVSTDTTAGDVAEAVAAALNRDKFAAIPEIQTVTFKASDEPSERTITVAGVDVELLATDTTADAVATKIAAALNSSDLIGAKLRLSFGEAFAAGDLIINGIPVPVSDGASATAVATAVYGLLIEDSDFEASLKGNDSSSIVNNGDGTLTIEFNSEAEDPEIVFEESVPMGIAPSATTLRAFNERSFVDNGDGSITINLARDDENDFEVNVVDDDDDDDDLDPITLIDTVFVQDYEQATFVANPSGFVTITYQSIAGDVAPIELPTDETLVSASVATIQTFRNTVAERQLLTFTDASEEDVDGMVITVGGVEVTLEEGEITAEQIATRVAQTLRQSSFITSNPGRRVTDNLDGTITILYSIDDKDVDDTSFSDTDRTGIRVSVTVNREYVNTNDLTVRDFAQGVAQSIAPLQTVAKVLLDQKATKGEILAEVERVAALQAEGNPYFDLVADTVQAARTEASRGSSTALSVYEAVLAQANGSQRAAIEAFSSRSATADKVELAIEAAQGTSADATSSLTQILLDEAATLELLVVADQINEEEALSRLKDKIVNASDTETAKANTAISRTDAFRGVAVGYDAVAGSFTFNGRSNDQLSIGSALSGRNELFGLELVPTAVDGETGLYGAVVYPNGDEILESSEQRYGIKVTFNDADRTFEISSGRTGDRSSVKISDASVVANLLFGFTKLPADEVVPAPTGATPAVLTSNVPVRGIDSEPATLIGNPIGINLDNKFAVDARNDTFVVTVDNVTGLIQMPRKSDYNIEEFRDLLERRINSLSDRFGRTVNGVQVEVVTNPVTNTKSFKFTTGTTGDASFLKVSGPSVWGLKDLESARGTTTQWIEPVQATDADGFPLYVDRDGNETTDPGDFSEDETRDLWAAIFLDKGELTFNTAGQLISPLSAIRFRDETIGTSGATLGIAIDYAGSTQFSNPFSVLAQDQDGRPEGDLIGLDIGDDGLVSANYSNGSQKNLAKIVLANFSNPTGLRQIGDASYYATSKSGPVALGEAGTAGYGTVRAGARERANVDLTQELIELITNQRNFQANAKAIETNNTLTQAIINIRS